MVLLRKRGARITYSDPYIPSIKLDDDVMPNSDMVAECAAADAVVIVTDHSSVRYDLVVDRSQLVVDTRNRLKDFDSPKIVRL
jgi:UDP-N-acetyl-D-glucosamine dehydrogenase